MDWPDFPLILSGVSFDVTDDKNRTGSCLPFVCGEAGWKLAFLDVSYVMSDDH